MASASVKLAQKPEPKFGYRPEPELSEADLERVVLEAVSSMCQDMMFEIDKTIEDVQRFYGVLPATTPVIVIDSKQVAAAAAQYVGSTLCSECQTPETCPEAGCTLT